MKRLVLETTAPFQGLPELVAYDEGLFENEGLMIEWADREKDVEKKTDVNVISPYDQQGARRHLAAVAEHRPQDGLRVDAVMLVEALVLDRDDRVLHVRRDVAARDEDPGLRRAERRQPCPAAMAVAGVDVPELLRLLARELVQAREILGDRGHEAEEGGDRAQGAEQDQDDEQAKPADASTPGPPTLS